MKKVFLFATVLLFVNITLVNAQQQSRRFSIFADPQISWLTSDTKKFEPNGSVMGFNIGFSADKYFGDRYAITTGLSINNLGGNIKYKVDGTIETVDEKYSIDSGMTVKLKSQYLTVPLGLKFRTNEIGYFTFTAQVGLAGHIRLKGVVWEDTQNIDKETATKEFSIGFASYFIGAGAEYSLGGSSSIQVGIIYANGITQTFKTSFGKISYGSLSLRVGVVF
ncbi:MAG TPA: hypothetical protein DIW31_05190 [Bacteroidales bacterium]|nr:hypothetical protein [Bacteroidales bacterium]